MLLRLDGGSEGYSKQLFGARVAASCGRRENAEVHGCLFESEAVPVHKSYDFGQVDRERADCATYIEVVVTDFPCGLSDGVAESRYESVATRLPAYVVTKGISSHTKDPHSCCFVFFWHPVRHAPSFGECFAYEVGCVFRVGRASKEVAREGGRNFLQNRLNV
jgi:hypothetical protein